LSKVKEAVPRFRQGSNCGQAILATYGTEYGLDRQIALNAGLGLGGGMGCGGEVCGAVSGAVLTIGLRTGIEGDTHSRKVKEETYRKVRELFEKFKALHGSVTCRGILGCDLSTKKGLKQAREKDLFSKICPDFVAEAARILEEVLSD